MDTRTRRGAGLLVALLAAAAMTAGGVADASIPDGHAVIHGCYSKNGGALRVIDADKGETCDTEKGKETPLDWNETGPPGPAGSQGPKGDPGSTPTLSTYTVDGPNVNVAPLAEVDEPVSCNDVDVATGGGFFLSSGELRVRFSVGGQHLWEVDVQNPSTNAGFSFHTVVQCLHVS